MLALALVGLALAAEIPAGDGIDDALAVQVSPEGLDAVAELVPALVPTDALAIDDMEQSIGVPAICVGGSYELSNIQADIQFNEVYIRPVANAIELDLDLTVALNDAANPFTMLIDAICVIDENCSGHIDPFNLFVTVPIDFSVEGAVGSRILVAEIGNLDMAHDLDASKLQTDCVLNDIEEVMNLFGLSVFDLILNLFGDQITELLDETLTEALAATNIEGELDLLGAVLGYHLEPSGVIESPIGLQISMASQFQANQAECVADDDPGSSWATLSPIPHPMDNLPGSHAAVHVSSDLVNQALYAAWRGGGLCMDIGGEEGGIDLGGLALDTSLIALVGGDGFNTLFPEPKPIEILLRPHAAPTGVMDGPSDVDLALNELELIFLGELDGRIARAVGATVNAQIGVNVPFDGATGEVAVDLQVDPGAITASLSGDAMVPGVEDKIRDDFPGVMATLLDQMLPSLVGDSLAFTLPTMSGFGLLALDVEASGPASDWLGAYAELGDAPYADPNAGCGCGGSSSTSTGDCGCASGGGPAGAPVVWLLLAVGLRRRQ